VRRTPEQRREFVEARSDQMRANMTGAEQRLWDVLEPLGFDAQSAWHGQTKNGGDWSYITDFYHPHFDLAVEVDGSVHDKRKGRDRRRTERLRVEYGIRVIRFSNNAVLRKLDEVRDRIISEMEGR
jgi:very-short-patch-repair endonuclease